MGVFFVRLFAIAGGGVEIDCPGFCTAILCNHRHIAFQHNGILLFKDGGAGAEICFHIGTQAASRPILALGRSISFANA